jgi:hypothetical protein
MRIAMMSNSDDFQIGKAIETAGRSYGAYTGASAAAPIASSVFNSYIATAPIAIAPAGPALLAIGIVAGGAYLGWKSFGALTRMLD